MSLRQGHASSEGVGAVSVDVSHLQETVFSLRSSLEEAGKEKEQMSQVIRANCEKIGTLEKAIQTKQSYINAQKEGILEKEHDMRKLEQQVSCLGGAGRNKWSSSAGKGYSSCSFTEDQSPTTDFNVNSRFALNMTFVCFLTALLFVVVCK